MLKNEVYLNKGASSLVKMNCPAAETPQEVPTPPTTPPNPPPEKGNKPLSEISHSYTVSEKPKCFLRSYYFYCCN